MEEQSRGRSSPTPDADNIKRITHNLHQALQNENEFVCNYADRDSWEVSMSTRDGAVHLMRFLKFWFDLPQVVFFTAVNYLDLFLARMQVKERFLLCVSVSCFNIAATEHNFKLNTSQLLNLSQSSECTVTTSQDMERMSQIVAQKLNLQETKFYNALDLLEIYMDVFKYVAVKLHIQGFVNRMLQWQQLCARLEVLICDSSCASFQPSVLALACILHQVDKFLSREVPRKSNYNKETFYIIAMTAELRSVCNINSSDYLACFKVVTEVLKEYDSREKTRYPQNLLWKFSSSTHHLMDTHYYATLNTITEKDE